MQFADVACALKTQTAIKVNLLICHGHSQVRDNAQFQHLAQAGHTPKAYHIIASPSSARCVWALLYSF